MFFYQWCSHISKYYVRSSNNSTQTLMISYIYAVTQCQLCCSPSLRHRIRSATLPALLYPVPGIPSVFAPWLHRPAHLSMFSGLLRLILSGRGGILQYNSLWKIPFSGTCRTFTLVPAFRQLVWITRGKYPSILCKNSVVQKGSYLQCFLLFLSSFLRTYGIIYYLV